MKMRVIVQGSEEFELDAEFTEPAIAAAISGESGEDVASEIIDYTDTERSDIDRDEYVTVTGDDGTPLWSGWLGGVTLPPPVDRQALVQLAADWLEGVDEATATHDELVEQLARSACARSLLAEIGADDE